jgi:hypothetical protein
MVLQYNPSFVALQVKFVARAVPRELKIERHTDM